MCELAMRELTYPDEQELLQRGGLENFTMGGGRPIMWDSADHTMPEGYQELTRRCWHQDPLQRPSAAEIVYTLKLIQGKIQIPSEPAPVPFPEPNPPLQPIQTPLYILVLERNAFKKPILPPRTCLAGRYEKGINGLLAFALEDNRLSDYSFKGFGGQVESRIIYKRHPGNLFRYIPITEYAEDMLKEKEEEFLAIMRDLGAKVIKVTCHEQNANGVQGQIGLSVGQFGGVNVGGGHGHRNGWTRDRSDRYENPSGSLPRFDEKRKYIFYPDEPDWIGIKESRLSSSPLISTTVTFNISTQDFNIGVIEAQAISIGGVTMNYNRQQHKLMSKTYSIEFFTSEEYKSNNLHLISTTWKTREVLAYLDRIQLQKYQQIFVENSITGNDLIYRREKFSSELKMTSDDIAILISNLETMGQGNLLQMNR
jgi:hypothetical protein